MRSAALLSPPTIWLASTTLVTACCAICVDRSTSLPTSCADADNSVAAEATVCIFSVASSDLVETVVALSRVVVAPWLSLFDVSYGRLKLSGIGVERGNSRLNYLCRVVHGRRRDSKRSMQSLWQNTTVIFVIA